MQSVLKDIFEVVVGSAMLLIFLRFMMEFAGVERSNPFAKVIFGLTRIVDIFGRIFPTIQQGMPSGKQLKIVPTGYAINTAALVLMALLRFMYLGGLNQLLGKHYSPLHVFFVGATSLVLDFLMMCQYILVGSFIVGWIILFTNSSNPLWGLINQLSEPIIAPFRKFIPPMGMLDFAPMIAFFVIILAQSCVEILAKYLLSL